MRLGEKLLEKGAIRPEDLEYALSLQKISGERLGRILLSFSLVKRQTLYEVLSEEWDLPYIELSDKIDFSLPELPLSDAIAYSAVIYGSKKDSFLVATSEEPTPTLYERLAELFPKNSFCFYVTTPWDIDRFIRTKYRTILLENAIYSLFRQRRHLSAYSVLTLSQYLTLFFLSFIVLWMFYQNPILILMIINILATAVFFIAVLFKFILSLSGAKTEKKVIITDEEVQSLRDEDLPLYTILVPVYHEASIVHQVVENVVSLDYPHEKLEILVLIEEDDDETFDAARNAKPPDYVHLVRIPNALPKTKPKACNVGLSFSRDKYLVVYDAEDIPDKDQLKKTVIAFQKGPENLVCVQAALNYFNWKENWLTRMFTLEYSYWFDYILPGLNHLKLPIPLGGTSNHFRRDRLLELNGWDPFNVTEDADLGIRATALGYTVGIINSTTLEEANTHLGNWIRQRSRWIKGYMQTTLVYLRNPFKFIKDVGLKSALAFTLFIGGSVAAFLAYIPTLILYFWWLLTGTHLFNAIFDSWIMYFGLFNLLIGNALGIYLSMLAVFKRKHYGLIFFALFNPIYWILHSIAAYKALWQLFTKPFYWEKTTHGLTRQENNV